MILVIMITFRREAGVQVPGKLSTPPGQVDRCVCSFKPSLSSSLFLFFFPPYGRCPPSLGSIPRSFIVTPACRRQGSYWGMSSSAPSPPSANNNNNNNNHHNHHLQNENDAVDKQRLIIALGVGLSIVALITMCLLYAFFLFLPLYFGVYLLNIC